MHGRRQWLSCRAYLLSRANDRKCHLRVALWTMRHSGTKPKAVGAGTRTEHHLKPFLRKNPPLDGFQNAINKINSLRVHMGESKSSAKPSGSLLTSALLAGALMRPTSLFHPTYTLKTGGRCDLLARTRMDSIINFL